MGVETDENKPNDVFIDKSDQSIILNLANVKLGIPVTNSVNTDSGIVWMESLQPWKPFGNRWKPLTSRAMDSVLCDEDAEPLLVFFTSDLDLAIIKNKKGSAFLFSISFYEKNRSFRFGYCLSVVFAGANISVGNDLKIISRTSRSCSLFLFFYLNLETRYL